MKQNTWLPLFTGYYNSIFDCSDMYIKMETDLTNDEYKEYYNELHKAGITQDYFNEHFSDYLDYQKGWIGSSEYICNGLLEMDYTGIINDVTFESLRSPKYYNYSTDSINCEIDYDETRLMQYLNDNKKELETYVKEKYTSRDGFSSSYTNEVEYWLNPDNHGEHEVGSLLQFVLLNEDSEAIYALYDASNCYEGFCNGVRFDTKQMIADFNKKDKK